MSACPVCLADLSFSPWRGESASDELCPSCGIQFGYNDARPDLRNLIYVGWREAWVANGRRPISGDQWRKVSRVVVQKAEEQASEREE